MDFQAFCHKYWAKIATFSPRKVKTTKSGRSSFFLSGDPWDQDSEIGSPWSDVPLHTHHIEMRQLDLQAGQTFLYLFDYGDQHEFDVTVLRINPLAPKGEYPRTLKYHGDSAPQYPDYDEESGEQNITPAPPKRPSIP